MSRLTSLLAAPAVPALTVCHLVPACATLQQRAKDRENLLTTTGSTARPPNTPERGASFRTLLASKVVLRTCGGTVRYVNADPLVCGRLYAGNQAAALGYS